MEIAMVGFFLNQISFLSFFGYQITTVHMIFVVIFCEFFLWMPKKMTLRRVLDVAVSLLIAMNVAEAGLQHKRHSGNT